MNVKRLVGNTETSRGFPTSNTGFFSFPHKYSKEETIGGLHHQNSNTETIWNFPHQNSTTEAQDGNNDNKATVQAGHHSQLH